MKRLRYSALVFAAAAATAIASVVIGAQQEEVPAGGAAHKVYDPATSNGARRLQDSRLVRNWPCSMATPGQRESSRCA